MSVVYKYDLESGPLSVVSVPEGGRLLSVGAQCRARFSGNGWSSGTWRVVAWFLVDPRKSHEQRRFCVVPTGQDVEADERWVYRGTVQGVEANEHGGGLVFHVFEESVPMAPARQVREHSYKFGDLLRAPEASAWARPRSKWKVLRVEERARATNMPNDAQVTLGAADHDRDVVVRTWASTLNLEGWLKSIEATP